MEPSPTLSTTSATYPQQEQQRQSRQDCDKQSATDTCNEETINHVSHLDRERERTPPLQVSSQRSSLVREDHHRSLSKDSDEINERTCERAIKSSGKVESESKMNPSPSDATEENQHLLPEGAKPDAPEGTTMDETTLYGQPSSSSSEESQMEDESANLSSLPPDECSQISANNLCIDGSGDVITSWSRETDKLLLETVQRLGAKSESFQEVSRKLQDKTKAQVEARYYELMSLFHSLQMPKYKRDSIRDDAD